MSGTGAELSRKRSDPSSFAVAVYQVGDRVQCLTLTKHALGTWLPAVIGAASLAGDGTFDCDLVGSDLSEISVPVSRLRLAKRQRTKDEEEKGEGDEEEKKQEARRTAAEDAGVGTGTTVKAGADVETQGAAEEAAVRAVETGAGPEAMEVPDDAVAGAEKMHVEGTEVRGTAESEAETGAAAETRAAEAGAAETGAAVAIKGKAGAAGAVADTVGDEPQGEDEVVGSAAAGPGYNGGGGGGGAPPSMNGGGGSTQTGKLFVGSLAWATTDDSLVNMFRGYGVIKEAKVMHEREDPNRSRGFGFVAFERHADAARAMAECNGRELDGRQIRVDLCEAGNRARRRQIRAGARQDYNAGNVQGGGGGGGGGSIMEQMWRRSLVPPRAASFPLPPLPHEREAMAAVVAAETAEVEDNTGKEPAKGKGKRGHAAMADNAQVPNICDQQGGSPLPRPGDTKADRASTWAGAVAYNAPVPQVATNDDQQGDAPLINRTMQAWLINRANRTVLLRPGDTEVDWALTRAGDVRVGSRVVALKSKFGFLQGAISVIVGVKKQTKKQKKEKKRNPKGKKQGEWVLEDSVRTRQTMGIRYVRQDDLGVDWALLPMSDEKGDERTCSGCSGHFDQSAFSRGQWKKGVKRRCKTCVPGNNDTVGQAPIKHHMQRRSTDAVAVAARRAALLLSDGALLPFPPTCGLESGANERRGRGGSEGGGARCDATCSTAIKHRAEVKKNGAKTEAGAICPGGLKQTVRPNPPLLGPPEMYAGIMYWPAPVRAICQAVQGSAARSGKRPSPASGFAPTHAWKKGDVGAYVERHPWWADDDLVFALQAAREQKTAVPGDVLKAVVEKLCTTGRIGSRFVLWLLIGIVHCM